MRFNFFTRPADSGATATVNHEGAAAVTMPPEVALYAAVATTFLTTGFYEKDTTRLTRIRALIQECDPLFVARLAVYAREKLYLRSVPLVLVVELARLAAGSSLVRRTVVRVVQRPDEITELLALYAQANGRATNRKALGQLSKQVQKGLAEVFTRFDAYQLAKYDRAGAVRLRDALFLTHAKGRTEAQQTVFDQLVRGELPVPNTWETRLSVLGQQAFADASAKTAAFRAAWENLVAGGQLGYMALLRNLRNLVQAGVSAETIGRVAARLADSDQVARARQLPFRFLSAYREIQVLTNPDVPTLLDALETAAQLSVAHVAGFGPETRVVLACDVSGSMKCAIAPRSVVERYDIGLLLAMLLQTRCARVTTGVFGDTWKRISLPRPGVLANVLALQALANEVGYSTNGHKVVEDLLLRREVADKVILFTDCQLWDSTQAGNQPLGRLWAEYRRKVAPTARLYLFDLAGLGTTPVQVDESRGVAVVAGWSNRVFDVLTALEDGRSAVDFIHQMEL